MRTLVKRNFIGKKFGGKTVTMVTRSGLQRNGTAVPGKNAQVVRCRDFD
jgi:hypothetical protein